MNLKVYNQTNAVQTGRTSAPTISFGKNGQIRLSKKLVETLNVKVGQRIEIAQDTDNPEDWYMRISDDGDGIAIKQYKDDGCLNLNSSTICSDVLESLGEEKLCAPIVITPDKQGWYPILTSARRK